MTDRAPRLCDVCFSPDGHYLASRGKDAIRVWDLTTWSEIAASDPQVYMGDGGVVFLKNGDLCIRAKMEFDISARRHIQAANRFRLA